VDVGRLEDTEEAWIPNEWAGSVLRYGASDFPITSNTETALAVVGDPSLLFTAGGLYRIIPADVVAMQAYLTNPLKPIEVLMSYSRLPVAFPALTLRLQSDHQARAFIGESVISTFRAPTESEYLTTEMTASYLVTIWTENPTETLWLYLLLLNYYVSSQQQFPRWGLHDVTMVASDLHPDLEYVPEQVYTRYLQLTVTRYEEGLVQHAADLITDLVTVPQPAETTIAIPDP
jgi:hypothetical protein